MPKIELIEHLTNLRERSAQFWRAASGRQAESGAATRNNASAGAWSRPAVDGCAGIGRGALIPFHMPIAKESVLPVQVALSRLVGGRSKPSKSRRARHVIEAAVGPDDAMAVLALDFPPGEKLAAGEDFLPSHGYGVPQTGRCRKVRFDSSR